MKLFLEGLDISRCQRFHLKYYRRHFYSVIEKFLTPDTKVAPKQRLSYLKLHLNKGYLILKMGPLKLLFYLTFVNWCTKGESPNKIRNVNVFGWNEIQKVELIILKTGILDTNRSTLFAYMRSRESQKKSIFYLAWVKLFFMFPLQLCGRCSADRFEEQPGLQHRLHCHQHYRHG